MEPWHPWCWIHDEANDLTVCGRIRAPALHCLGLEALAASGQYFAQASTTPLAMPALTLKRSSLVMPGFLGTSDRCVKSAT